MGFYVLFSGRKKGGQNTLLTPAVYQVPLTQNNPSAKVARFEVAYSTTLQGHCLPSNNLVKGFRTGLLRMGHFGILIVWS